MNNSLLIYNQTHFFHFFYYHQIDRVGDITPHCGVDVKTKHQMEEQAMKEIGEYCSCNIFVSSSA